MSYKIDSSRNFTFKWFVTKNKLRSNGKKNDTLMILYRFSRVEGF